jgi:hypothetical protein
VVVTASSATLDTTEAFSLSTAVLAASLAFETYSEPKDSRWERGSLGCDVAFKSDSFTAGLYKGVLELTPLGAEELSAPEAGSREGLLTGAASDLYALAAVVEGDAADDTKRIEGRINDGVMSLQRCANLARTSTVWANSNSTANSAGSSNKYSEGCYSWSGDEAHYLHVRDPDTATLVLSLLDEELLGDDLVRAVMLCSDARLVVVCGRSMRLSRMRRETDQVTPTSAPLVWPNQSQSPSAFLPHQRCTPPGHVAQLGLTVDARWVWWCVRSSVRPRCDYGTSWARCATVRWSVRGRGGCR